MDLDTFEMSSEKRAFTVECVDMNANAPGRLYHYHRCEIVFLFLSLSRFFFFLFPFLFLRLGLPCFLTLNLCVR